MNQTNDIYYNIHASIDEDDDFELNIGNSVTLEGFSSEEEASEALIKKLQEAKIIWAKGWSIRHTDEEGTVTKEESGDYTPAWTWVLNAAIEALRAGEYDFTIGGNQTIEVWTHAKSRSAEQAYKEAYSRVSPEDRKTLGLQAPSTIKG